MAPYFFVFGWLAIFSVIENFKQFTKLKSFFYIATVIILVLFAGLRKSGVGADDLNYIEKFLEIPSISYWLTGDFVYSFSNTWMEPSYLLVGSIVREFSNNYVYLFLSIASISVGLASLKYYRYSKYAFLALTLFFVHAFLYRDINQVRSAIAAAIGLFLIPQIYNRDHIKVILTIFFAATFHTAALSFFVIYFLSFFKMTNKKLINGYLLSLLLGVVGIGSIFLSLVPDLGYITVKLVGYADSKYSDSVTLFDITNIKNTVLFLLLVAFNRQLREKVEYFDTMMLFYFSAVTWRIAFNDFGIFAARIATFFGIVEVLLVPTLLFVCRQKIVATIGILLYAFFTLYLNLYIKEGRFPYELSIL